MGGVRALRAFQRLTGAPAPEVFHTNEGHAGFLGVERIRELMSGDSPLSFDEALRRAAPPPCSPPTPRSRPASTASRPRRSQHFFSAGAGSRTSRSTKILDLGARGLRRRRPDVFNMAVMGLRLGPARQRRREAARRGLAAGCSRPCGRASTTPRCRSPRSPTACTSPTWVDPRVSQLAARAVRRRRRDARAAGTWPTTSATRTSGRCAARCGSPLVEDVRRRLRAAWKKRGARRRRAGLDRLGAGPGRPDHRLRPPGADLQAAHADAARPGPAQGPAAAPRRTRSSW